MSGSSNLNSFRDRGQVAVQLVSCGVLLPGLVQDCTQPFKYVPKIIFGSFKKTTYIKFNYQK